MTDSEIETEAEKLFLQGVELEQTNNLCDAIRYYRKAMQLVPDIDTRVFKKSRLRELTNKSEENGSGTSDERRQRNEVDANTNIYEENDENDDDEPLPIKFQRLLAESDRMFHPKKPTKALHLSDIPEEIIHYILRWVVSDELDLRSLDQCACVCRGFYLYARNPQIWKSACIRSFKNKKIKLGKFDSWRDLFINYPRIATNGCYIGETKYFRQGERSFQDLSCSGLFHLVVYYRYLRFFADGSVLMINTPDTPNLVVGQLKYKNSRFGAVIPGSYRIIDDFIFVTFKVQRIKTSSTKSKKPVYVNIVYNMKFQIKKFKKWYSKLLWKEYKLVCPDETHYEEEFEIREQAFPPLRFSVVKSYLTEAEQPLP